MNSTGILAHGLKAKQGERTQVGLSSHCIRQAVIGIWERSRQLFSERSNNREEEVVQRDHFIMVPLKGFG